MALKKYFALSIIAASVAMSACSSDDDDDTTTTTGGTTTVGTATAGTEDAGTDDVGTATAGTATAGTEDAGTDDVGTEDAGTDDAGTDDAGMGTDGTDSVASPTATMSGNSIIDLARGADNDGVVTEGVEDLSSLVETLGDYPDLVDLLDDETKTFTVFAPDNAAFAALDLSAIPEEDREAAVRNVLVYHVVPNTVYNSSTDQTLPQTLTTAQGADLTVMDDGTGAAVIMNGDATVAIGQAVDSASNGVVYIIDTVLDAPAAPAMGGTDVDGGDDGDDGNDGGASGAEGSTLAALENDDDLSMIAAVVGDRAQSLQADDAGNRSQIVFAPRNSAYQADVTSILAYTVTEAPGNVPGGPAPAGTYTSFSGPDGTAGGNLTFVLAGEGDSLTVNDLDAELVATTSGPTLYVFGD